MHTHKNCLREITQGIFKCIVTGVVVLVTLVGEHQDHLSHQTYDTTASRVAYYNSLVSVGTSANL